MFTRRFSYLLAGLLGLAFQSASVAAQEPAIGGKAQEKGVKQRAKDDDRDGLLSRAMFLMPPHCAAELKLTAEQRTQVQKLEQDFKAKRMESLMRSAARVMTIVESMEADDEKEEIAPILSICHEVTGGLLEARRTRVVYEKKMLGMLNPDQQAKFVSLKEQRPRDRREHALLKDGKTTFHFYYTPEGQERLQLNEEQKQKLSEMQKEMDTRLRSLLTEEQRRVFDSRTQPRGPNQPKAPRERDEPRENPDK
jgi:Spy/CpxP family protein refolding chaperone